MAWSDPKTWSAAEVLTASDMNQFVSDNLSALYALVQGGGRKNLLHNGAMQVHQRGTSTASITTGGYYTADRWNSTVSTAGTWTQSVEADAPTGSGFRKSVKWLCTTANASLSGGSVLIHYQVIEGQNLQAVRKGTASAEPVTLSFWTKSNKIGTYIVSLYDANNGRRVSAAYTVASSGTWEQQAITFPADTTGAFDNDTNASLYLQFWLAAGTDYTSGTLATTWAATVSANVGPGQTNLASNVNNYWQVTGIQLEVGSAATGYEHKDYGTELAECQRYYETGLMHGVGYGLAGNFSGTWVSFAVTKRGTTTVVQTNNGNTNCSATPASIDRTNGFSTYRTVTATGAYEFSGSWTASAEL